MTNSKDYFPALSGLRGVAACWVFAFHTWQYLGSAKLPLSVPGWTLDLAAPLACGYFGVDLFFVLSGFLLAIPWHRTAQQARPAPSLGRFWLHRCRRVLPAYWVQFALLAAFAWFAGERTWLSFGNLLPQALLLENLARWTSIHLLNAVWWTMPIEWDFYVVLLLLAAALRWCRWWLGLTAVLVWVVSFRLLCYGSLFDPGAHHWLVFGDVHQLPGRVDQFFFGVLAAWLVVNRPAWLANSGLWFGAGILVLAALVWFVAPLGDVLMRVYVPYIFFHHSLVGAALALVVVGAAAGAQLARRLLDNAPLQFLGRVSYSLYLWHYPMLVWAQKGGWFAGPYALPMTLGFLVPGVVLVSWLSYRCIEAPFLAAKKVELAPVPART